jgi:hypothetical protein
MESLSPVLIIVNDSSNMIFYHNEINVMLMVIYAHNADGAHLKVFAQTV